MVKQTIRRMVENWPEESTFALHGTPYKNVASIRRIGLVRGDMLPYVCPFPSKQELAGLAKSEILERAIGSALFAEGYAVRNAFHNPKAEVGDLPAVLIFRGPAELGYGAYDAEYKQQVVPHEKERRSFGKIAEPWVPPQNLAKVVRLTKKEHRGILSKAKGNPFKIEQLARVSLTFKTLKALRVLVEREAARKAK